MVGSDEFRVLAAFIPDSGAEDGIGRDAGFQNGNVRIDIEGVECIAAGALAWLLGVKACDNQGSIPAESVARDAALVGFA